MLPVVCYFCVILCIHQIWSLSAKCFAWEHFATRRRDRGYGKNASLFCSIWPMPFVFLYYDAPLGCDRGHRLLLFYILNHVAAVIFSINTTAHWCTIGIKFIAVSKIVMIRAGGFCPVDSLWVVSVPLLLRLQSWACVLLPCALWSTINSWFIQTIKKRFALFVEGGGDDARATGVLMIKEKLPPFHRRPTSLCALVHHFRRSRNWQQTRHDDDE
jgi:hypothetical protein